MSTSVYCKFVSKKVNKVRWQPARHDAFQESDIFVAGSWDDPVNTVSLWHYPASNENINDDEADIKQDPILLWDDNVQGSITDLKYVNAETMAVSLSNGTVLLYKHTANRQALNLSHKWDKLHYFPNCSSPCTSIATRNDEITTVGEDGRICVVNLRDRKPSRVIDDADCCSLTAVCYLKQNEILTANSRGQLNIWDLRSSSIEPSHTLLSVGEQVPVFCITQHPTQPQIIASGSDDGNLCIWDLRQDAQPATLLNAHDGAMLEVKFHPKAPNHLFTCSADGTLWHWDGSALASSIVTSSKSEANKRSADDALTSSNPWFACSVAKQKLDITTVLPPLYQPINSLDIQDDVLLCGADNEAIYLIPMDISVI